MVVIPGEMEPGIAEPDTGAVEFTREALERSGFAGFIRLSSAITADVPSAPGVYVIYRTDTTRPTFLPQSQAGHRRDPSQSPDMVDREWVDGAQVVYIGKATALRKRIAQYRRFGASTSDAHWGGRYIWQLQDQADLLVAWRVTAAAETARAAETALIGHFMSRYRGRMPFANLRP